MPFSATGLAPWVNRLLWAVGKAGFNLPIRRPFNRYRRALGLAPISDVYTHLLSERPILAADAELAPVPADCRLDVRQVPCLHPLVEAALPPKLDSFLAAGPAPVYFGFGSMTDPHPLKTTQLLLDTVARLGCRALISQGWAGLGQGPLPEGVMTVGSVSHASLFRRVAAVVHHGGAGTTTTAARAGAPQVLIPHLLDQYYWARQVQQQGIAGPPLRRSKLDAVQLAHSIRTVVDNEWVESRARELGERLRIDAANDPVPHFLEVD
jgi:vancomycin aglycone glucosyltransferase